MEEIALPKRPRLTPDKQLALPGEHEECVRLAIVSFDDGDRGRSLYVNDPAGHVVECWTWDVKGHLAV